MRDVSGNFCCDRQVHDLAIVCLTRRQHLLGLGFEARPLGGGERDAVLPLGKTAEVARGEAEPATTA